MTYPYILQGDNVTLVIDGVPHTINKTHLTYTKVVEAIKLGQWDQVKELINPVKAIVNYSKGYVTIVDSDIHWKGQPLHTALAGRIVQMLQDGFDIDPMVQFMHNLMQNPSKRAVDELYGFLEKNSLPITPDGHFLAYKKVKHDYKDCYTGTMDNSVGKVVEMERNMVDDNRDNTCSTGLHFCSHSYLSSFSGDRTVIVKINPCDVVSIPSDYNNAKGRACRYEVIGEVSVTPDDKAEFTKAVQSNANSVRREPKTGRTPFYRGYTDGYTNQEYNTNDYWTVSDMNDYEEGYEKGEVDRQDSNPERYRYVKPVKTDLGHTYAPSSNHPKLGKTEFYRGYSDGFYGYDQQEFMSNAYYEGYAKGENDAYYGRPEHYRFEDVDERHTLDGVWPYPKKSNR